MHLNERYLAKKNIVLSQKWTTIACIYPQTTIHLDTHDHFVVEGWSGEVFDQVKSLVQKEVPHTLEVTTLAITLATSKTFLFTHLLNEDGEGKWKFWNMKS
jgi:hypothetical protein